MAAAPARLPASVPVRGGPVDLRADHAQSPAAAAPAAGRGGERPPACPLSGLSAPQSARAAGRRHSTEDRGLAPPRAGPAPQPRSPEPGRARAWGHTRPRDSRAALSDPAGLRRREGPFAKTLRSTRCQQLDNAPRVWTLTRVSLLPGSLGTTETGQIDLSGLGPS